VPIIQNPVFFIYFSNYGTILFLLGFLGLSFLSKDEIVNITISIIFSTIVMSLLLSLFSIYEMFNPISFCISFIVIVVEITLIISLLDVAKYRFSVKDTEVGECALIFRGKNGHKKVLAIIKITEIPKNISMREEREIPRIVDRLLKMGNTNYLFYHLVNIARQIPQLSYEIVIRNNKIEIQFILMISGRKSVDKLVGELEAKVLFLETTFKTVFNGIGFRVLTGDELTYEWKEILGLGNYKYKKVEKNIIQINRKIDDLYISILKFDSIPAIKAESTLTQIDQLINNFLSNKINCHFISSIKPSFSQDFSRFKQKVQDNFASFYNSSKQIDEMLATEEIRINLLNIKHMEFVQFWKVSNYLVLKSHNLVQLQRNIDKAKAILKNIFSDSNQIVKILSIENYKLLKALPIALMRGLLDSLEMTTEQLIATFHLPEQAFPSTIQRIQIPNFELPPIIDNPNSTQIYIGDVLYGNQELFRAFLDIEEVKLNVFITGLIGMGKTEFTKNMLIELTNKFPKINWMVLEWKGDYRNLIKRIKEPVLVFILGDEQNSLKINLFDPHRANPENHANKIFSILKEVFKSTLTKDSYSKLEFSPQMEKITREVLIKCIRDKNKRDFKSFFEELRSYSLENRSENKAIVMTIAAIENRFTKFVSGILGEILNTDRTTIPFEDLMKHKVVFDLSNVIYKQGTKEDVRLLMNIILKYAIDEALRRGVTNDLKHVTIIEDAQLLVPSILREISETSLGEDIPLLLRGVGESMISIATRPEISSDIISNSAVKISFRLTDKNDTDKVSNYQNLNEEQEKYLRTIPKREAIMSTLNFPFPFRIRAPFSPNVPITLDEIFQSNTSNFRKFFQMKDYKENKLSVQSNNFKDFSALENFTNEEKELYFFIYHMMTNGYVLKRDVISQIEMNINRFNSILAKLLRNRLLLETSIPVYKSNMDRRISIIYKNPKLNVSRKIIREKMMEEFRKNKFMKFDDCKPFDFFIPSRNCNGLIITEDLSKQEFITKIRQMEEHVKMEVKSILIIVPFFSLKNKFLQYLKQENLKYIQLSAFNYREWKKIQVYCENKVEDLKNLQLESSVDSRHTMPNKNMQNLPILEEVEEFCKDFKILKDTEFFEKYSEKLKNT